MIIFVSFFLFTSCVVSKVPGCAKQGKNVKLTKSVTKEEIKEFTDRYFKKLIRKLSKEQKKILQESEITFEYTK